MTDPLRLTPARLRKFERFLGSMERSPATIQKYLHDIGVLSSFVGGEALTRQRVLDFKAFLIESYAATSVNSMLAAMNCFLRLFGRHELCVKQLRIQRQAYCPEGRELTRCEYCRLVAAARQRHDTRLSLMLQTICSTGIRVSELQFVTVEAVERGEAAVRCKGKNRHIFIVDELRDRLRRYAHEQGIVSGAIFVNRDGRPLSRHTVWRSMKSLCRQAGVQPEKVFPHNLRHLFARTFYGIEKDIAKLADILGHASINTTRIYIMTTGAEHRRQMQRMRLVI